MTRKILIGFLSAGLFVGCQTKPTQVKETTAAAPIEDVATYAARMLSTKPAIVDVRSEIDFGMSHLPGAINIRWEDLNAVNNRTPGLVDADRFALARRLSLWGIDPDSQVLIVGQGPEGRGEEGRVGWVMRLLGLSKVETASVRLFRLQNPRADEGRPANKNIWKPQAKDELEISPNEFKKIAFQSDTPPSKARRQALQTSAPLVIPWNRVILDVSHPNERQVRSIDDLKPTARIVRSEWRSFYDQHGRGACTQATAELTKNEITAQHEILIVDEDGVGAAAVGFVLSSCGFGKPRVLSTGLRGL